MAAHQVSEPEILTENDDRDLRIVLVGKDCYSDQELLSTAQGLSVAEVVTSDNGLECIQSASENETLFVLSDFEGEKYHKLHRAEARIIGPPVILACKRNKQVLPYSSRPLFCMSMQRIVVCFTGFKKERDRVGHLVDLVHHMGGSVRRDMTPKVTHLIANCTGGEKYKYAVTMGMPIMSAEWVERLWEERYNLDITANSESMMDCKVKPFFDCCLSFMGFSSDEQKHMEDLTVENGGTHRPVGSEEATHLVVEEVTVKELPTDITLPSLIVRREWFWGCIQMAACAEEHLYLFQQPQTEPERSTSSVSLRARSRKRKRLKQLAVEGELGSPYNIKRRSGEVSAISLSPSSFLDASRTPDKSDISQASIENVENKPLASSKVSKRQQVVMELLHTETNYTAILHTLLYTFKEQIENSDQYSGALLAPQDTKIIFGNIPPIYEVHSHLKDDLTRLLEHWTDCVSVGDVILKHADGFMKAYPNFVNFFENTKETIMHCDQTNPRFHAFLKVCLSKPECGRQTLQELLIRPVQRLPSVILLLGDILKNTPSSHDDRQKLEQAIESLKNVLTHINEDKRKTEGQMVMFDIVNDIENCPANLLSSHRSFVTRIDVVDTLNRRGDLLSLFVFTDSIEICKRRAKGVGAAKSLTPHKSLQKTYKHMEMLSMSSIKRVLDFTETEDCMWSFGLVYRNKDQHNEKLLSFMLDSPDVKKDEMLMMLCKTIANALCRTDFDSVLAKVKAEEFHISTRDLTQRSIKAKISKRVSRAFSINRTPGKLKRAVSHVFSPFKRDTPGDLASSRQMVSTFDLTEESPSGLSHFDDSDCISLGAYSLQEEGSSPQLEFTTPSSARTPKNRGLKWATIGPQSASKYLK